ncbi:response regulator receiver protein [Natrialba chahannaoensis JCM 10990]|uniref:Response regulator receiver protein n=1 Tax=Natrialba chahannaoensis JCM 10990 TaxID=1227492 RepID=M0B7H0_9EURY|nr:response regulator [Natrialba chahannaoensis]ELZ06452.1 response regulator receiver protein [Natrialba chahannaoensis JCM 10990]
MTGANETADVQSILLVEDDNLQARLYQMMLQQLASQEDAPLELVSVEHVETLAETRNAIDTPETDDTTTTETGDCPFDLILLDLNLPDSNRLDTLTSVLEFTHEIPVVILTAMDDTELGQRAVERGAQDFLMKEHVTPRLLGQTVAYAVERQHQRAEIERQRRELALLHWHVRHEYRGDAAVILGWASELTASDPDTQRTIARRSSVGDC